MTCALNLRMIDFKNVSTGFSSIWTFATSFILVIYLVAMIISLIVQSNKKPSNKKKKSKALLDANK